jgi:hypothetical protein
MGVEQAASAGSRINKRSAAAMELELERGPGCSDLHQVARCRERQGAKARRAMRARRAGKVPFGAFPLLSTNMEISTEALQGQGTPLGACVNRGPLHCDCQPVPPPEQPGSRPIKASHAAWNESKLQRKHTAAFHDQPPLLRCQLAVAGHTPLRGIQDDVIPITLSCSQGGAEHAVS